MAVDQLQSRARIDAWDALAGVTAVRCAGADIHHGRDQDDVLDELPERIDTKAWVKLAGEDAARYGAVSCSARSKAEERQVVPAERERLSLSR